MDPEDPLITLAARSRAVPRAVRVRVGVGAAVVLLVAAFGVAVAIGAFAPHGGDETVPPVSFTPAVTTTAAGPGRGTSTSAVLYVHVLGAVTRPGLYTLAAGSRVVDAVGAAGGMTKDADAGGVNLARPLGDGEQLVVPHVGETPVAPVTGGAPASGTTGDRVDLNTATEQQLEELPRIGPAMAQKILRWREQNGRFSSVDDLLDVGGIGQKTLDGLKDLVVVR